MLAGIEASDTSGDVLGVDEATPMSRDAKFRCKCISGLSKARKEQAPRNSRQRSVATRLFGQGIVYHRIRIRADCERGSRAVFGPDGSRIENISSGCSFFTPPDEPGYRKRPNARNSPRTRYRERPYPLRLRPCYKLDRRDDPLADPPDP